MGVAGCGGSDSPAGPPPNKAPTIQFTFGKIAVSRSASVTLTVSVSDPDDDPLNVTWAVSRGLLNAPDQGSPTMLWSTPTTPGIDTVTVTVTDGQGGKRTISETIKVGTLRATNVSGATTWTVGNSPYILRPQGNNSNIAVIAGARLTIPAGVEIFVDKAAMDLKVEGTLVTQGTRAQPVTIVANQRTPNAGFWKGIRVEPNSSQPRVELVWTRISHAVNAVDVFTRGDAILRYSTVSLCSGDAIFYDAADSLVVEHTSITNNLKSGIRVERLLGAPRAVIIRDDSIAVNGRFGDPPNYGAGEAGISLAFNDATGAVLVDIRGNEISRNDFPGIRLGDPNLDMALFPRITNNGIFGNDLRLINKTQIRLEPPFTGTRSQIVATGNWWGQPYPNPSDSLAIKGMIFDKFDNATIQPEVVVTPWRTSWP